MYEQNVYVSEPDFGSEDYEKVLVEGITLALARACLRARASRSRSSAVLVHGIVHGIVFHRSNWYHRLGLSLSTPPPGLSLTGPLVLFVILAQHPSAQIGDQAIHLLNRLWL